MRIKIYIPSGPGVFKNLTLLRIKIRLFGRVKIGVGRGLVYYAFKCPIHGLQMDYPHGYDEILECARCDIGYCINH